MTKKLEGGIEKLRNVVVKTINTTGPLIDKIQNDFGQLSTENGRAFKTMRKTNEENPLPSKITDEIDEAVRNIKDGYRTVSTEMNKARWGIERAFSKTARNLTEQRWDDERQENDMAYNLTRKIREGVGIARKNFRDIRWKLSDGANKAERAWYDA